MRCILPKSLTVLHLALASLIAVSVLLCTEISSQSFSLVQALSFASRAAGGQCLFRLEGKVIAKHRRGVEVARDDKIVDCLETQLPGKKA